MNAKYILEPFKKKNPYFSIFLLFNLQVAARAFSGKRKSLAHGSVPHISKLMLDES